MENRRIKRLEQMFLNKTIVEVKSDFPKDIKAVGSSYIGTHDLFCVFLESSHFNKVKEGEMPPDIEPPLITRLEMTKNSIWYLKQFIKSLF